MERIKWGRAVVGGRIERKLLPVGFFPFPLSFNLIPQPVEQYCQHSGWIFFLSFFLPHMPVISGNTVTATQKCALLISKAFSNPVQLIIKINHTTSL